MGHVTRRPPRSSSPRREELLDRAYRYALEHGLADLSLRPLAAAIDELGYLAREGTAGQRTAGDDSAGRNAPREDGLTVLVAATWRWLAAEPVRPLLTLWTEAYGRSLVEPGGPWSGFASQSVADWLEVLAAAQPADRAGSKEQETSDPGPAADRTLALAVLRGCLLDLLATGDTERVGAAIARYLRLAASAGAGAWRYREARD